MNTPIVQKTIRRLTALQRRGAQVRAGAFCTTASAELDIEMHLQPMKQQMERAVGQSLLGIITHPIYSKPTAPRKKVPIKEGWLAHYICSRSGINSSYDYQKEDRKLEKYLWHFRGGNFQIPINILMRPFQPIAVSFRIQTPVTHTKMEAYREKDRSNSGRSTQRYCPESLRGYRGGINSVCRRASWYPFARYEMSLLASGQK